jgi:inhibitor of cysteine peptidase
MKKVLGIVIVLILGWFIFTGFQDRSIDISPTPQPDVNLPSVNLVEGLALINKADILILESFPVQVRVAIEGSLSDSCTELGDIITDREDNKFTVSVTTLRPAEAFCAQVIKPFEKSVPLDVYGLPAGAYTATINNLEKSFSLDFDNIIPE